MESADWFGELEDINVGDPSGDELVLTPKKCAALTKLSNEVIDDSDPSVLDAVGTAMTRAVALTADRAILGGAGGKAPLGVHGQAGQHVVGVVTIDALIDAAGLVADVGGVAGTVAYVNPANHTALMKEKDARNGRPLLTPDYSGGPSSTIYGLAVWPTKGVAVDTALVCDPTQVVVAVRNYLDRGGQLGRDLHRRWVDLPRDLPRGLWRQRPQRACEHRGHDRGHERAGEQEVSKSSS